MNQEKQPEALRLAEHCETYITFQYDEQVVAELRRLHALSESQRAELVAEAARTAEETLRANQMTEQHRMQCNISKSAVATLVGLGYTDRGGEQWAAPIGKAPDFNLLDAANARIADLEDQLSAIGAGGVEALRKRECLLHSSTPPVFWDMAEVWRQSADDVETTANTPSAVYHQGVAEGLRACARDLDSALQAAPPAPAAVAVLTTQQIIDRFDFLEGMVTESTYRRIVETAATIQRAALAAAPAQAVAVPSDAQAPEQWIDDPHDIEQGMMLNPEWVRAQEHAAAAQAAPTPTEAPIDEPVTKQMIDAGAKAAREYMARTGGNNLTVIYRAMRALAPAGAVSAPPAQEHATQLAGQREKARPGFVLVPLRLTRAMDRVMQDEGWQWEDLLAAANAVTEDEYESIANDRLSKDEVREVFLAHGFTIKPSQSDLKPYVYEAAEELEHLVRTRIAADPATTHKDKQA